MDFRHEWKIEINTADHYAIRQRLKLIAARDSHAADGTYFIRSLYFDDFTDQALREKVDGINRREKFRIRSYNKDTSLLHLEKKSKLNGLCQKQSVTITHGQARALVNGDLSWMMKSGIPLVQELYCKMKAQGLRPKTIVDYVREPFVYRPGNVRVTFDYEVRTGLSCTDFLNPKCVTIPAGDPLILMEVKWDAFLPDTIRSAIQTPGRRAFAFSKYARCRIYG